MRVGLISLARRGGMVHFHIELFNALNKLIPIVAIISKSASLPYQSEKAVKLLVDTGDGVLGTLFNALNPFTWYKLFKILRGSNVDLFHVVAPHEWNPILGLLIKILNKPLIYTIHDPKHHLGIPIYFLISESIFRKMPNAMIVLSKQGKEQLVLDGIPAEKVFYIPLGIYSRFAQMHPLNVSQEKMILFFGRIEPYKGLDLLLKAMPDVFAGFPDWNLVIAGTGDLSPYQPYLNHRQIKVINRYISDEEIATLMQQSRFLVLPYIEATQSGVIPIAYAFARPVIATNVGSLGEMVLDGKNGLLIPPRDHIGLSMAIKSLMSDPLLCESMGKYALEMSQREWDSENIAHSHLDVYSNVFRKYGSIE